MFLTIVLGLIGLGIVIFIHEGGHFIAAKLSGISVEIFSLGWGKKLLSFRKGETEYRLSLFPVGGYCKMKGDDLMKRAWQKDESTIPYEEGSFFSASPWKRIVTVLSGPISNFLFAVIVLSLLWYIGFSVHSFGNRIILVSDYAENIGDAPYPADKAGLKTGDRIISINGQPVENFRDIQEAIAPSAGEELSLTYLRNGEKHATKIIPDMDEDTGIGRIGIYAWVEPIIGRVQGDSSASIAGLREGDRIVTANDKTIKHSLDFLEILNSTPDKIHFTCLRDGIEQETSLVVHYDEKGNPQLGFSFDMEVYRTPRLSIPASILKGAKESYNTLLLTVKSIGMLFKGINIREAVSGPIRITYYVGEVASQGFQLGIGSGLTNLFRFLSLLSVALFLMNLLPIPALDGGLFLLFLIEGLIKKPLKPKIVYRYQIIGFTIIFALFIFTTFNDLSFFLKN